MAAGGFLLSLPWLGWEEEFPPNSFAVCEAPSLMDTINYYLEHKDERERIAKNGYNAVKAYNNTAFFAERIMSCAQ